MVSIETHLHHRHREGFKKSPVCFHLSQQANNGTEEVELTAYNPAGSTLRLTDSQGTEIWHYDRLNNSGEFRLDVNIRNLSAGIYYVEIHDGFFHQVRMVRIAAA
ncbi:MAG: T9SS type A sorting domain-containing protein [Bacteroidia bacterium]|nr:T9SS type A sorting domain-containing protein [Bacteroidia bacterium]